MEGKAKSEGEEQAGKGGKGMRREEKKQEM